MGEFLLLLLAYSMFNYIPDARRGSKAMRSLAQLFLLADTTWSGNWLSTPENSLRSQAALVSTQGVPNQAGILLTLRFH